MEGLEELNRQLQRLRRHIEIFLERRRVTLRTIQEVVEKLNSIAVSTNVVRGVGDVGTIVGSLCTMIAAGLSLAGAPVAGKLLDVGSLITKTGNVASTTGSLTEHGFSLLYLNEVEKILEADKRASGDIRQWLTYSRDLDANIRALFGCSLGSGTLPKVLPILKELPTLWKVGSAQINHYNDLLGARSGKFAKSISEDSEQVMACLNRFFKEAASSSRLHPVVKNVSSGLQVLVGVWGICGDVKKMWSGASVSLPATSMVLQPTQGAVTKCCIFETVNIAASVLSLMSVTDVITTGQSRYSEALNELKSQLKREFLDIERLQEMHGPGAE